MDIRRLAQVRRAIEHKSAVRVSDDWTIVMAEILELPVAAWNDPGDVAGEIDTETGERR